MSRVYMASKLTHAAKWLLLQNQWQEIEFVARWPNMDAEANDHDTAACRRGWMINLQDVTLCNWLIVYAEPHEHLRGALVEVGMALALDKQVIIIGEHPDFGSWQHHPRVIRVEYLEAARAYINSRSSSNSLAEAIMYVNMPE